MLERIFTRNWFDDLPLITVLIVPAVIYIIKQFCKGEALEKPLPSPPCSKLALCYSLIKGVNKRKRSNTDFILCGLLQVICGLCKIYGNEGIFRIHVHMKPFVFIFKPETAEAILSSPTVIDKANEYQFLKPWLGTGLLTSSGKKWRYRRKLLTPTFHFRILEDFLPIFNEQSNILVSKMRKFEASAIVDVVPLITSCTIDIISETAMGVSINAQEEGCNEYVQAVHEIGNVFLIRILRPWLYYDFIFNRTSTGMKLHKSLKIVHNFTRKVIKEKKEELLRQDELDKKNETSSLYTKKRTAFLELLLKYHLKDPSFTEEDIREEVDTFMFAGHDTTAMTISFALWLTGLDENVQRLIHEELDDIFMGDNEREITRNDLSRMKYLECVIKETLRLYPPAPLFGREANEAFKIGEYTIEKGTFCLVIPMELHRDTKSFPNPEKFDPERFFPENVVNRHPYAFVPFSAGPRNCIGQRYAIMESKTVLANIFRNFTVISKDARDKVRVLPNIVISNIDPLRLYFSPRNQR
ncbi:cytochrome P450 4V2 [Parasteatoda tepidariorum]|uniref:cytochrome P450 4V2 n=1 Tax=Parasteatoda tepidariorum TaxID=114398 RepID=UPI000A2C048A